MCGTVRKNTSQQVDEVDDGHKYYVSNISKLICNLRYMIKYTINKDLI